MSSAYKLIKLDIKQGVGTLLKSQEMSNVLMDRATSYAGNAGSGFKAKQMGTRVIVVPETKEAEKDNFENNTLLKARR